MDRMKIKIKILGSLKKDIYPTFKDVLKISNYPNREAVLFVDYSEFDVPIEYIFTEIIDPDANKKYNGKIVLKSVSQDFLLKFDLIPMGHKTICKFKIEDQSLFNFINKLPKIDHWQESNKFLIFT
jgi:hypothetical protein